MVISTVIDALDHSWNVVRLEPRSSKQRICYGIRVTKALKVETHLLMWGIHVSTIATAEPGDFIQFSGDWPGKLCWIPRDELYNLYKYPAHWGIQ